MAKQLAYLDYTFVFDPSQTWSHLHEFEADLARHFKQVGLEAEIVRGMGSTGRAMLFIKPKPDSVMEVTPQSVKSPRQQLKKVMGK
jgi:hypothetical protein